MSDAVAIELGVFVPPVDPLPSTDAFSPRRAARADGWVHRPSADALFAGRAPIELMTSGWVGDLARVRLWLPRQALG